MRPDDHFLFPPFRLDLRSERLWREGEEIPLRPKLFALLRYLVEHPGRVVTREELRQAVWPGMIVSEGVLRVCLGQLREALEDKAEEPHFIETLAGRGYRFIAPLTTAPPSPSSKPVLSVVEGFQVPGSRTPSPHLGTLNLEPGTPVVGREAELGRLQRALAKALRGERQVVFVTGEPGIGKTTVVDAFLQQAQAVGDLWLGQGQCVEQYGTGEAYLPILEALGRIGRSAGGERFITLLYQHAPTWLVQMPGLLSAAAFEALQRQVASATKDRMLREMVEAVEVVSAECPLVLWLEDLHWADYSTFDWLAAVGQRREPARVLVIVTYRPAEASLSGHPLKGVKQDLLARGQCAELWLPFLTPDEVTQYLAVRYPQHQFPLELGQAIHRSTDGNPLFMVNLVDYLAAQGVIGEVTGQWQLQASVEKVARGVPEGLRQLIEKHIERLSTEQQQVLEVASVAGAEFSAAAVAAGVGATVEQVEGRCEGLVRHGHFLRALGPHVLSDGTVAGRYGFLHALYQTVLYERLSAVRRMRLHRRVGESEEQVYGSRAEEIAAELAVHFERGQDMQRAVKYLQRAAANALQRSAYREAISLLTRGLDLLKLLPDTPERTQLELMLQVTLGTPLIATRGYGATEVGKAYARARELCRQVEESPQLFPTLQGLFGFSFVRAEHQTARELGEQLLRLAQGTRDSALLVEAHRSLGGSLLFLGELARAQEHFDQGLTLYDPQRHRALAFLYAQDPGVTCLVMAAWALWFRGYPDQALARVDEALALARNLSHPVSLGLVLFFCAIVVQLCHRQGQRAQQWTEEAIALSTEQEFPFWLLCGQILHGAILAQRGQQEVGIEQVQQGLAAYQALGARDMWTYFLALLAEAYSEAGQAEKGLAVLAEALGMVDETGERYYEAELFRLKGELTLQSQKSPKPSHRQIQNKSRQVGKSKVQSHRPLTPKRRRRPKRVFTRLSTLPASRVRSHWNCGRR